MNPYETPTKMAEFLLQRAKGKYRTIYIYLDGVDALMLKHKDFDTCRFWKSVRLEIETHEKRNT